MKLHAPVIVRENGETIALYISGLFCITEKAHDPANNNTNINKAFRSLIPFHIIDSHYVEHIYLQVWADDIEKHFDDIEVVNYPTEV